LMDLGPRTSRETMKIGWYACTCGRTGFVAGPLEPLTATELEQITEVESCPACCSQPFI